MYDLMVRNARLYPMAGDARRADVDSFAVLDGRIAAVPADGPAERTIDAGNRAVTPGLIDCHTHALYAGDRAAEHRMRLAGRDYTEIARAGGGILATVRAVKAASEQDLVRESLPRVRALAREGVTTLEIKSGYALDSDGELKMLRAIRRLNASIGVRVTPTLLGAHAIPAGSTADEQVARVVNEMLPAAARAGLADAVDIYVESIAFDTSHVETLFRAAREHGLHCRAHAGQFSAMNACAVAARHGAVSCDHLEYVEPAEAEAMSAAGTVAVLLPAAWYFLREKKRPPVAMLREAGVTMAVASDLNPGSAPVASLLTALHMAVTSFDLEPDEALLGVTLAAAQAIGRSYELGSLEPGKRADFCIWPCADPALLIYQLGGIVPDAVFIDGILQ